MPKRNDFKDFVSRYKFPVLAICEGHASEQFRMPGYVLYPSNAQLRSSRVMMAIRPDIPSLEIATDIDDSGEFIACKLHIRALIVIIACIYLPPGNSFDLQRFENFIASFDAPYFLCGDFNAHSATWGSSRTSRRGSMLESFFASKNLCVLNDGTPTFFRGDGYTS